MDLHVHVGAQRHYSIVKGILHASTIRYNYLIHYESTKIANTYIYTYIHTSKALVRAAIVTTLSFIYLTYSTIQIIF